MISIVQIVRLNKHTNANFTYKKHGRLLGKPLTINPAIIEVTPRESPIHGMYANPAEWYKKPTKSPKKQAINPKTGPIIIPVNAERNKVRENCVSASLNSKNIFDTTQNAVKTAIYAMRWLSFLPAIVSDSSNFCQDFISFFCIIKTSR